MQHEFLESRCRIVFDSVYRVVAFDKTAWFRYMTGQGLKGVDYMALRRGKLYLIEIKNYQQELGYQEPILPGTQILIEHVEDKFHDSLRMLNIVVATLHRHLLFRIWWWWSDRWRWVKNMEPHWAFWKDAQMAKQTNPVVHILWFIHKIDLSDSEFPAHWLILTGYGPFEQLEGVFALDC